MLKQVQKISKKSPVTEAGFFISDRLDGSYNAVTTKSRISHWFTNSLPVSCHVLRTSTLNLSWMRLRNISIRNRQRVKQNK